MADGERVIEVRLRAGGDDGEPWLIEVVVESDSFEQRGGRNVHEALTIARQMVRWPVLRKLLQGKQAEVKLKPLGPPKSDTSGDSVREESADIKGLRTGCP